MKAPPSVNGVHAAPLVLRPHYFLTAPLTATVVSTALGAANASPAAPNSDAAGCLSTKSLTLCSGPGLLLLPSIVAAGLPHQPPAAPNLHGQHQYAVRHEQ